MVNVLKNIRILGTKWSIFPESNEPEWHYWGFEEQNRTNGSLCLAVAAPPRTKQPHCGARVNCAAAWATTQKPQKRDAMLWTYEYIRERWGWKAFRLTDDHQLEALGVLFAVDDGLARVIPPVLLLDALEYQIDPLHRPSVLHVDSATQAPNLVQ